MRKKSEKRKNDSNYSFWVGEDHEKEGAPGHEIFVGGLPSSVTATELQEMFSSFGKLKSLRMMRYRDGLSRGFAFVTLADWEATQKVLNQKFHILNGKQIECKLALNKEQSKINIEHEVQRRIYVGNLTPEITSKDLFAYFSQFGKVLNVRIATTIESDEPKGFAFVIFSNANSTAQVLNYAGKHCLKGVVMYCNSAYPKTLIEETKLLEKKEPTKKTRIDFHYILCEEDVNLVLRIRKKRGHPQSHIHLAKASGKKLAAFPLLSSISPVDLLNNNFANKNNYKPWTTRLRVSTEPFTS